MGLASPSLAPVGRSAALGKTPPALASLGWTAALGEASPPLASVGWTTTVAPRVGLGPGLVAGSVG